MAPTGADVPDGVSFMEQINIAPGNWKYAVFDMKMPFSPYQFARTIRNSLLLTAMTNSNLTNIASGLCQLSCFLS